MAKGVALAMAALALAAVAAASEPSTVANLGPWLWDGRFAFPHDADGRVERPSRCTALIVADTIAHDDATTCRFIAGLRDLGYGDEDIVVYMGVFHDREGWRYADDDEASYLPSLTPAEELASGGRYIRQTIDDVRRDAPDACFDIVSHSLGGIAARLYLQGEHYLEGSVAHFVSTGTAHRGSDLAVARSLVERLSGADGLAVVGRLVGEAARALDRPDLEAFDPNGPAVAAMHPRSPELRYLNARPLPRGVAATTVQGVRNIVVLFDRGDVPGGRSLFVGAQHDEPWDDDFPYLLYNSLSGRHSLYLKSRLLGVAAAVYGGLLIRPLEYGCAIMVGLEPYTRTWLGAGFSEVALALVRSIGGL